MNESVRFITTNTAYNRYLRHGVVSNTPMSGSDMLPGYMLHEEFDAKLIDALRSENVIRSLCSEVTTKDDRIMPIVRGHGQPSWVPEGSTIPIVKDTFDRMVLDSHLLAELLRVTSELMKDSAVDIEQYLADTFASRMATMEEAAFVAGDGVNKPLGLVHQAQVGCETQMAGTVSIEDVVNLIFSLPEQYRRNGTLLMNEKTLLSLHKQCLAQGTNLWFGKTNDGKDDTFFDYRIVRSGAMPDAETGNPPDSVRRLQEGICQRLRQACHEATVRAVFDEHAYRFPAQRTRRHQADGTGRYQEPEGRLIQ